MPATVVAVVPATIHLGQAAVATVRGAGQPDFAPFVVRSRNGDRYVIQCLAPQCAPPTVLRLGRVRVHVVPRATDAQVGQPLRSFARETARLPTTYRISPTLLLALVAAAAAACLAAALALAWPRLRHLVPERRDARTPLERALTLVRESLGRGDDDRRRALDLLGRVLPGVRGPARSALDLAWSEQDPTKTNIEQLLRRLEP